MEEALRHDAFDLSLQNLQSNTKKRHEEVVERVVLHPTNNFISLLVYITSDPIIICCLKITLEKAGFTLLLDRIE